MAVRRKVTNPKQAYAIAKSEAKTSSDPKAKERRVMEEFQDGTLTSSSGGGAHVYRRGQRRP